MNILEWTLNRNVLFIRQNRILWAWSASFKVLTSNFGPGIPLNAIFFSFTLCTAFSRVGRGNLVLRISRVPYFPPNIRGIACWVAEVNAALCRDTGNEIIKYFISSSENRTHNQSCHTFVHVRHDWPRSDLMILLNYVYIKWLYNITYDAKKSKYCRWSFVNSYSKILYSRII